MEWFVRNCTDREVTITLRFDIKKEKNRADYIPLKKKYVPFGPLIVKINNSTSSLLADSISIQEINNATYKIVIPPNSTVELTQIIPTDYNYFTNVIIEFEQGGSKYAVNSIDAFKKRSNLNRAGSFPFKNLYYFDYKKAKN
jgi:hypothetical protein